MGRIKTCVIVGAGLSGLRAASILLRKRGLRVIILEGRDRIGGRTHTSTLHSWKTPLDLGCAWIHGTTSNPLTPIAKDTGASFYELETSAIWDNGSWLCQTQASKIFEFVFGLGERAVEYSKHHQKEIDADRSFYDFCLAEIDAASALSATEKVQAKKLAHFYTNISAAEVTQQSLRNYLLEEELPGESPLVASTYAPIINHIARPAIDAGCITLKQKVFRIEQKADSQVAVWYRDQSNSQEHSIDADAVVLTVPLGVLQSDSIEFVPRLPETISAAVHAMGMGSAEKLFVKFKTAFWLPQRHERQDNANHNHSGKDMYAFLPQTESDHLIEFISLAKFPVNTQAVLLCFSAAEVAHLIAQKWIDGGRSAVERFVLPYIQKLPNYIDNDQCAIEDMFSTDWLYDEFSYGSYSYSPVGSIDTARDCDNLARGLPSMNLFFAGEHAASKESGFEIGVGLVPSNIRI